MVYQPKTGEKCNCRPGIWRDNCPACEGTGWRIDFRAIRNRTAEAMKDTHLPKWPATSLPDQHE